MNVETSTKITLDYYEIKNIIVKHFEKEKGLAIKSTDIKMFAQTNDGMGDVENLTLTVKHESKN